MHTHRLCFVLSLGVRVFAGPVTWGRKLFQSADLDYDDEDLTWIKKLAAVGDSYSAGIGAGNRLGSLVNPTTWGDWKCSRYDHSYPALLNAHPYLGDAQTQGRAFQFESCSGAVTKDVIDDQIPQLNRGQDVILLSAGGNDAELVHILNSCVYQIFTPSNILSFLLRFTRVGEALQEIGGNDLSVYSRGCDGQLDATEKIINSARFSQSITQTIKAAMGKLSSSGTLYYTGYGRFWDERAADDDWCSQPEHTWSLYLPRIDPVESDILPDFQKPAILTKERRLRMNDLVDKVNTVIKNAVIAAGNQAVFIDYDPYIEMVEGRFCAPGTREPDQTKYGLNFYELDTDDPLGTTPFKRDDATAPDGTFEAQINLMAELAYTAKVTGADPDIRPANNTNQLQKRGTFLPDGYGRIFHPQVIGHELITNLLVYEMGRRRGEANGITYPAEIEYDDAQCPLESPLVRPNPVCADTTDLSGVFYNAFHEPFGKNTYDKFCQALTDSQTTFDQTVDINGDVKDTGSKLMKRTPPPSSVDYSAYSFHLSWVPDKNQHTCLVNCSAAFDYLSNSLCGHQGSAQNMMTSKATVDVGCGTYGWQVEKSSASAQPAPSPSNVSAPPKSPPSSPPPPPPTQQCNPGDSNQAAAAVDPQQRQALAAAACSKVGAKILPNGQGSLNYHPGAAPPGWLYSINWVKGCSHGASEWDPIHPLADHPELDCTTLFVNSYNNCDNGGHGGSIQAGCLLYSIWGW